MLCALDQANSTVGSENYVIGRKSGYEVEDVKYILNQCKNSFSKVIE
jgi:hypothetical protein